jgi:quercetin dioxygenase-like cupin family protein
LETDTEAQQKLMEKEKEKKDLEGLISAVNPLTDLVAYQKGSVVSRTIIDKKAGTVTLFSFDEGQGLSEHTAPFDALVCLLDGEADISISGNPLHLRKGEMTIMPANQPHALKAVGRFKMLLVMIRSQ